MLARVVLCDVCDRTKKEVNDWLEIWIEDESGQATLKICHAGEVDDKEEADYVKDVCGQECLTSLVNRWVSTGSLEK